MFRCDVSDRGRPLRVNRRITRVTNQVAARLPRRHRPDYQILLYMALLMLVGLIMIYAVGPQRAQLLNYSFGTENYGSSYFFMRHLLSLGVAIIAFVVMSKVSFRWLQGRATKLLLAALAACLLLAIAGAIGLPIAPTILGAVRWFDLGPLGSVQPAEFLKFTLVLFVADFLATRFKKNEVSDMQATLIPLSILIGVVTLFVVELQQNLSTGLVLVAIVFGMLFVAGLRSRIITAVLVVGIIGAIGLIATSEHRRERVATFFQGDTVNLEDDSTRHINQAKIAIGSGGLTGLGIGNSIQSTGYLPEAINDSLFAIIGETFGFVGLVAVIGLFVALYARMLHVADHLNDVRLKLIVIGIFAWLAMHTFINIAAMIGFAPLTGITLPLVSFGGTSMVFIAGALGLVFQLSQYTVNDTSVEGGSNEGSRSRRGVGRSRHAYRSGTPRVS
jgi:cell division protein FtsW